MNDVMNRRRYNLVLDYAVCFLQRLVWGIRYRVIRYFAPFAQAMRWPLYIRDRRRRKHSEWSPQALRYVGMADRRTDPRVDIVVKLLEISLKYPGDIAECGVFQGQTSLALGIVIKEAGCPKKIYALDSFEGFNEVADTEAAYLGNGIENPLLRKGAFSETSLKLIEWKLRATGLAGIILPVKGYFQHTLPTLPTGQYCFVHLDCDLGESYRECLEYFYPRMAPGGIVCFDEYHIPAWPLTTQVIDDFFTGKPENPAPFHSTIMKGKVSTRWYVQKSFAA